MKQYKLIDYIILLKRENLIVKADYNDSLLDTDIKKITYNSKEVEANSIFVCKGLNFKEEYLQEAINKGALFIISNERHPEFPSIQVSDIRKALAVLSALYFDYPSHDVNMIGITGTKGKSTIAFYTKSILDTYFNDTAIVSSIYNYDGIKKEEATVTTPESLDLEHYIWNAKESHIENLVMEVSSQALKLDRVYNILYDIGVFTNISIDHISSIEHPDFQDYFNSKLKLLEQSKTVIINLDMDHLDEVLEHTKNNQKVITYSIKNPHADIYAYDIKKISHDEYEFWVKTKYFNHKFILGMPGLFNVSNALASIAIASLLKVPVENISKGLRNVKVMGRMETYLSQDKSTVAIVDYAHNKLSFESLLGTVKKEYATKKMIVLFGCPGDKAQIRRKDMGLIANEYADYIYLTTDDPGHENPALICNEIASYIKPGKYEIIIDREKAIEEAIQNNPGCVIVIAGKGAEKHQKAVTLEDYKGDATIVEEIFQKELISV